MGNKGINISKEDFKKFMETMCDGFDKEYLDSPMFKHLMENSKYLEDPRDIHCMLQYPFEKALSLAIQYKLKKSKEVANLYVGFDFLERHVSRLCSELYGSACSVDKGRFIVRSYIKYKESGDMPKLDWNQEYTYHYPESGSMEQWMKFVQEVGNLQYGIYKEFLTCLVKLHGAKTHPEYTKKIEEYEKKKSAENINKANLEGKDGQ